MDRTAPVGMTVPFVRQDLESASTYLANAGFVGVEVFLEHLGPGIAGVPPGIRHAEAARAMLEAKGLEATVLNCITYAYKPLEGAESLREAGRLIAGYLELADALGCKRVLLWDCESDDPEILPHAASRLAESVVIGNDLSGLGQSVLTSFELHPNTVGWKYGLAAEVASKLSEVGAGVCLDFCHAGVAFGPDFMDAIEPEVDRAINLVHWSDSDCATEQLHFPPGRGIVNLQAAESALQGRDLQVSWDLFSWPAPREAIEKGMGRYLEALERVNGADVE